MVDMWVKYLKMDVRRTMSYTVDTPYNFWWFKIASLRECQRDFVTIA